MVLTVTRWSRRGRKGGAPTRLGLYINWLATQRFSSVPVSDFFRDAEGARLFPLPDILNRYRFVEERFFLPGE
jgi:hypothetical protein